MHIGSPDTVRPGAATQAGLSGRPWASLPVPLYGPALAMLGLSLLVPGTWPGEAAAALSSGLEVAGIALLMGAVLAHIGKAWLAPTAWAQDMRNPATAPFMGQIGVALSLLCELHAGGHAPIASAFFASSTAVALVNGCHAYWLWQRARPSWRDASPAWLLPPVQWLYLGALAPHHAGLLQAPMLIVGGALSACVCTALWRRARQGPPWPVPAQPAFAVLVALPAVASLAALAASGAFWSVLAMACLLLTFATWLGALAALPRVRQHAFRVSWWAYGMPLSAAAIAFQSAADHWGAPTPIQWAARGAGVLSVLITLALLMPGARAVHRFLFASRAP